MMADPKELEVYERSLVAARGKYNQKDYKFYVFANGKIYSGWEYKEDAQDGLEDAPTGAKVLTKKGLSNKGVDVDDNKNWWEQG